MARAERARASMTTRRARARATSSRGVGRGLKAQSARCRTSAQPFKKMRTRNGKTKRRLARGRLLAKATSTPRSLARWCRSLLYLVTDACACFGCTDIVLRVSSALHARWPPSAMRYTSTCCTHIRAHMLPMYVPTVCAARPRGACHAATHRKQDC